MVVMDLSGGGDLKTDCFVFLRGLGLGLGLGAGVVVVVVVVGEVGVSVALVESSIIVMI